jgi:hypothetical protein
MGYLLGCIGLSLAEHAFQQPLDRPMRQSLPRAQKRHEAKSRHDRPRRCAANRREHFKAKTGELLHVRRRFDAIKPISLP